MGAEPKLDFDRVETLTFDCYGTLIDWETGLLAALRPILDAHGAAADDEDLLELYGRLETEVEAGPYRPYREVLTTVLRGIGEELAFAPSEPEMAAFAASVGEWPAFDDSADALALLGQRFRLAVITNCDDDLFAASARRLGEPFDWAITAERAGAYKPEHGPFELALETIDTPRERTLHVAQSLFHDHVPAKELGLATVWVDRRRGRARSGATPPAEVRRISPSRTCAPSLIWRRPETRSKGTPRALVLSAAPRCRSRPLPVCEHAKHADRDPRLRQAHRARRHRPL
jgi:2-haloacid dehalogenase